MVQRYDKYAGPRILYYYLKSFKNFNPHKSIILYKGNTPKYQIIFDSLYDYYNEYNCNNSFLIKRRYLSKLLSVYCLTKIKFVYTKASGHYLNGIIMIWIKL